METPACFHSPPHTTPGNAGGQAFTPPGRRLGGVLSGECDEPKAERHEYQCEQSPACRQVLLLLPSLTREQPPNITHPQG